MFCMQSRVFTHSFDFDLINMADSNALQETFIGSTLPSAVVCAPSAGKNSEKENFHNAFGDSDRETHPASSLRLNFGINSLA